MSASAKYAPVYTLAIPDAHVASSRCCFRKLAGAIVKDLQGRKRRSNQKGVAVGPLRIV